MYFDLSVFLGVCGAACNGMRPDSLKTSASVPCSKQEIRNNDNASLKFSFGFFKKRSESLPDKIGVSFIGVATTLYI